VTTLIVAAGGAGEAAAAALVDADISAERVATLASARDRFEAADVVVVGDPEGATAEEVRAAAPADLPLVRLGANGDFETAVPRPVEPEALVHAVRLAERVRTYRTAVDDLYRLCRDRAAAERETGDVDHVDELIEARRRAERAFRGAKRMAESPPYDRLIGSAIGAVDAGPAAFADLDDPVGEDEGSERDGASDDRPGQR
jgi:hypothetical protein